jgi:hypothetical protein
MGTRDVLREDGGAVRNGGVVGAVAVVREYGMRGLHLVGYRVSTESWGQHDQMLKFEKQQLVCGVRVVFIRAREWRVNSSLVPGKCRWCFDIQSRSLSTCLRRALIGTDAYDKGDFVRQLKGLRQADRDCVKRETKQAEAVVNSQMLTKSNAVVEPLMYCVAQSMGHEAG